MKTQDKTLKIKTPKSLNDLSKEELIELNQYLLDKIEARDQNIKEIKEQNNWELGTPRSATFARPLPPNRRRRGNSLPNSAIPTPIFLPSPPIQEDDEEVDEFFYETLISDQEKANKKLNKEIQDLQAELKRAEETNFSLQSQNEEKNKELTNERNNNQKLLKDKELSEKEKKQISHDLQLTNEDFLERDGEVERINKELTREKKRSKSLERQLESQIEESNETENKYQALVNQVTRLNDNRNSLKEEKVTLQQLITEQQKEYQVKWEKREKEYVEKINKYRVFNSLENEEVSRRRVFNFNNLSDADLPSNKKHARTSSLNALSNIRKPRVDLALELSLKSPSQINQKGNYFSDETLTNSPAEEAENPFENSEKRLSSTLDSLINEINDYGKEEVTEIPTEAVAEIKTKIEQSDKKVSNLELKISELEVEILGKNRELAELSKQSSQKDEATQDLLNENIILKNQIRDLEQALCQLRQDNLTKYEAEKDKLTGQIQEKDWQLSAAEIKKLKFHNFTKGLEEVFPLTEPQKESLPNVGEPEIARLYYLKSNIFRGVNKLKDKVSNLEQKQEQEKNDKLNKMKRISEAMKELNNTAAETKKLFSNIEIIKK